MTVRTFRLLAAALTLAMAGCGGDSGSSPGGANLSGASALKPSASAAASASAPAPAPLASQPNTPGVAATPLMVGSKISTGDATAIDSFKPRPSTGAPVPVQIEVPPRASGEALASKPVPAGAAIPAQIGFARNVGATASPERVSAMLGWSPSSGGGNVSALRFRSAAAKGLRVGLLVRSLPLGGVVRFYADGADKSYEISAQEILAAIDRNVASGDTSDAARTYWSPNLGGEAITVEIEVPAGTSTDAVQVSVPFVSHVVVAADTLESIPKLGAGAAGACNKDVNCNASYGATSNAVALMEFVEGANTYYCSGTLLNNLSGSAIPYFLSANHCINSQTVASSLRTRWFYRSVGCGNPAVNPGSVWLSGGATLLYAAADTDTSFMRLNNAAPSGALYAAWSVAPVPASAAVAGVHHPQADLQKYSEGVSPGLAGQFYRVFWNTGTTEPGSSGSGLFQNINGSNYLIGQLYGGTSACNSSNTGPNAGVDAYGRFDAAYSASLHQWLSGGGAASRVAVYRLYNSKTSTHFYTTSAAERDSTVAKFPQFSYEGVGFYASSTAGDPVYRFYNTKTGAHFYTISQIERNDVLARLSEYSYEGISWYGSLVPNSGATPMYRFYNTKTSTHFYTTSAGERDSVQQNYPQFSFEGVGYYAWLSPS